MQKFDTLNELAHYLAYEALKYLAKNGPTLASKEIYDHINKIARTLQFDLDFSNSYGSHSTSKYITAMNFKLVGFSKAGWLKKASPKQGYWTITDKGIQVSGQNLDLKKIMTITHDEYWAWKKAEPTPVQQDEVSEDQEVERSRTVRDKLLELDPYEFQDLVAGLLQGMGYFIDFNAPRGKDGGIDLICYRDPLGAETPRIKVQCKHRPEANISRGQVSEFAGVIKSRDEIGIFVTSGFYSKDARRYAIENEKHIRLIDGQELEDMWVKYYSDIPKESQLLLPISLIPVLEEN